MQFGIFGLSAYSASKFAIRGFAECLLKEVSKVHSSPINIQRRTELKKVCSISY